jgi:hypothetical protein
MDHLYQSNAEETKLIHAMIFSDNVCDEHNPGHWTESNGDYVEPRESDLGVCKMPQWMTIAAVKWTLLTVIFIGKDKTKWGKVLHTFNADDKIF